ncbi:hypothetical protein RHSIM_Rhsim04G0023000 [Rhododendron simsii]|uniref:Transmembrane protein n=1 Tax=Rhododendron simsii TaxID=118357 RepID=A0A834H3P9_RHOSS|nr:hypothetical protein RHSIM_Rhsim04G0023000 [Rhododendron simsii]
MLQYPLLSSHFNFPSPLSHPHNPSLSSFPLTTLPSSVSARLRSPPQQPWLALAQVPETLTEPTTAAAADEGPIELPPSSTSIFATTDDPSPLQLATSILLTGAISIFLFRSLRRRAKRAKELDFDKLGCGGVRELRSSGAKLSLKEEAMESLKAMTPAPADVKGPPSPVQTFLGGISAGVIALILYKFTITVEGGLNRQTLSDSYSVRQITITIRTIINGLCYLATFVFGINSLGLFVYSAQLALNSLMGDSSSEGTGTKDEAQKRSNLVEKSPTESSEISKEDQGSDSTQ